MVEVGAEAGCAFVPVAFPNEKPPLGLTWKPPAEPNVNADVGPEELVCGRSSFFTPGLSVSQAGHLRTSGLFRIKQTVHSQLPASGLNLSPQELVFTVVAEVAEAAAGLFVDTKAGVVVDGAEEATAAFGLLAAEAGVVGAADPNTVEKPVPGVEPAGEPKLKPPPGLIWKPPLPAEPNANEEVAGPEESLLGRSSFFTPGLSVSHAGHFKTSSLFRIKQPVHSQLPDFGLNLSPQELSVGAAGLELEEAACTCWEVFKLTAEDEGVVVTVGVLGASFSEAEKKNQV